MEGDHEEKVACPLFQKGRLETLFRSVGACLPVASATQTETRLPVACLQQADRQARQTGPRRAFPPCGSLNFSGIQSVGTVLGREIDGRMVPSNNRPQILGRIAHAGSLSIEHTK